MLRIVGLYRERTRLETLLNIIIRIRCCHLNASSADLCWYFDLFVCVCTESFPFPVTLQMTGGDDLTRVLQVGQWWHRQC